MAFQSSGRQFYVGVGGQQAGPYSEDQVLDQIRQGQIPSDALVWYEGLGDWQPISGIEYFRGAFEGGAPAAGAYVPPAPAESKPYTPPARSGSSTNRKSGSGGSNNKKKSGNNKKGGKRSDESTLDNTFARNKDSLAPIFSDTGGGISSRSQRQLKLGAAVGGGVLVLGILFYSMSSSFFEEETLESPSESAPASKFPPRPGGATGAAGANLEEGPRRERLRASLALLATDSKTATEQLRVLVVEKSDDTVAKEALQLYSDEQKKTSNTLEVGRLLLEIKRPADALPYFLQQQPQAPYDMVEQASYLAYELSADPVKKRDYLIQNIRVLLSPLKNTKVAIERVQKLAKEFPGQANPFRYYLQSADEKLTDLFDRISFYFVKSLMAFIDAEFPEVRLTGKPLVELKRDKLGKHRIVGTYKGDVLLSNDRLKGIFITFWLVEENWNVVDTNLTPERRKYASEIRAKLNDKTMERDQVLGYLESLFQAQFPSTPLYDRVKAGDGERKRGKEE